MLNSAFLHLPGIGEKKLQKLKALGIQNWNELLERIQELNFSEKTQQKLKTSLLEAIEAFSENTISYFVKYFHPKDKWRILSHYYNEILYFDIETDHFQTVTLIGAYYKGKEYVFLRSENIDDFLYLLENVQLAVSFNGSAFDIPILLKYFHLPEFPVPHVDLRWVLYHEGIFGGLKEIESQLKIERDKEIQNFDGREAIYLWYRYNELGEKEAKDLLIRYCMADVVSLKKIIDLVILKESHLKTCIS